MKYIVLILALLFANQLRADILQSENGLEVSDTKGLFYILSFDNAPGLALTEQDISSQIELRLRAQGIRPVAVSKDPSKPFLHIIVIGNQKAFNIVVSFRRQVLFTVGEKAYTTTATTWEDGTSGTHGDNPDFIIRATLKYLDQFTAAYLKANDK